MGRLKVIANALTFAQDGWGAPGIGFGRQGQDDPAVIQSIYLRNSFCSLFTARQHNPDADILLIHTQSFDPAYEKNFINAGIELMRVPFSTFRVPETFKWKAAYYKLDALQWLSRHYEQVLMLDTDTVCVAPAQDIWEEAADRVLLYETGHRISFPRRRAINEFGELITGAPSRCPHYGGEAIAGSAPALDRFLAHCLEIHEAMKAHWDYFADRDPSGDELIKSLAAGRMPESIGTMNPYVERYWTDPFGFNLVSTNYKFNPVDIWHLPAEKQRGMLELYDILTRPGVFPSRAELARIVHLELPPLKRLTNYLRGVERQFRHRNRPIPTPCE